MPVTFGRLPSALLMILVVHGNISPLVLVGSVASHDLQASASHKVADDDQTKLSLSEVLMWTVISST